MCSSRFTRRHALRAPALTRVTRRIAALQGPEVDLLGVPIMCPIPYCKTLVPPSFAPDGEIEYRCYVGNHGRIGLLVNGRVELTVRTFVSPRHGVYPSRPRCSYPGCSRPRNSTCGRDCCLGHCLQKDDPCGGYKHDSAREGDDARAPGRAESLVVHPGTPLFLPSPTPTTPPPELAPLPGIDYDPSIAAVQLVFLDRELTVKADCTVEYNLVDLKLQSLRVRETLLFHQVRPGTLEYLDSDGKWHCTAGRAVPTLHGRVYMRAQSTARIFPPAHYIDMAPRMDRYARLITRNVAPDIAFETVFGCEPTQADYDSLQLGRKALDSSPSRLREQYAAAGRSDEGRWSDFVHTCFDLHGACISSPPSTPTPARSRPAWSGPPSSDASSSRSFRQNASPPPMLIDSDSE